MFNNSFESSDKRKMIGYKVTDSKRTKKYGIAANCLKMLLEKSLSRFKLTECRLYIAKDGSEITDEDYFMTVEPQTLLIIAAPDEEIKTDFELMYEAIRHRNSSLLDVADMIKDFVNANKEEFEDILREITNKAKYHDDKIKLSLKREHVEWFQGQDARCNTKEEVMARRAQDRIRGYYYKTKDEILKSELYKTNGEAKAIFDRILKIFQYLLIGCDYLSMIFDRSYKRKHPSLADETDASNPTKKFRQDLKDFVSESELMMDISYSLCTDRGDFYCQGLWNQNNCAQQSHLINPYANRENLILFQVWNLDHQIEISRSVIPSLIENVRNLVSDNAIKCSLHHLRVSDLSIFEYFLELFTVKNLKLVHIVCHDKGTHDLKSNGRLVCEKCDDFIKIKEFLNNIKHC